MHMNTNTNTPTNYSTPSAEARLSVAKIVKALDLVEHHEGARTYEAALQADAYPASYTRQAVVTSRILINSVGDPNGTLTNLRSANRVRELQAKMMWFKD